MWVKPPRICLPEKAGQLSKYLPLSLLFKFYHELVLDLRKSHKGSAEFLHTPRTAPPSVSTCVTAGHRSEQVNTGTTRLIKRQASFRCHCKNAVHILFLFQHPTKDTPSHLAPLVFNTITGKVKCLPGRASAKTLLRREARRPKRHEMGHAPQGRVWASDCAWS